MIAMVTGAGRGIGKSIADALEGVGYTVARCIRGAKEFNSDLGYASAAPSLINEVIHKYGRLDLLVNNARASERTSLDEEDEDSWDREIAVDLKSAYFLGKYAIANMNRGAIVNIGSITTHFASHESAAYQISKGAVLSMTRALASLGAKKGVRCNAVLPGLVIQEEHSRRYYAPENADYRAKVERIHPLGRAGHPADIARAVLFLAEAPWITGTSLVVDGGLTMQELAGFTLKENPS